MKFVELKKSLEQNINNVYLLTGTDRFLCYNALNILKGKLKLTFSDLNSVVINEENFNEDALVEACEVLPFGDEYRFIIVKDTGNYKKVGDRLLQYLKKPCPSSVLVFFAPEKNEYIKSICDLCVIVDCNPLDEKTLTNWILNFVSKRNVKIETKSIQMLMDYTSNILTRISSELEKLTNYVGNGGVIKPEDIDTFVEKDEDYQIYEFTEAIALGKNSLALSMLEVITRNSKNEYYVLSSVYNYFRRLLFIKMSNMSDFELAKLFGAKEFAIKKMREKLKFYSAKSLKKIIDLVAESDYNIKSGKMEIGNALKFSILQILQLRLK